MTMFGSDSIRGNTPPTQYVVLERLAPQVCDFGRSPAACETYHFNYWQWQLTMDTERQLLNNMLDVLDRLYDRKIEAMDVKYIVIATSIALAKTRQHQILQSTALALDGLLKKTIDPEEENGWALTITNNLRLHLAEALYDSHDGSPYDSR